MVGFLGTLILAVVLVMMKLAVTGDIAPVGTAVVAPFGLAQGDQQRALAVTRLLLRLIDVRI